MGPIIQEDLVRKPICEELGNKGINLYPKVFGNKIFLDLAITETEDVPISIVTNFVALLCF